MLKPPLSISNRTIKACHVHHRARHSCGPVVPVFARLPREDPRSRVSKSDIGPEAYRAGFLLDRQFGIVQAELIVVEIEISVEVFSTDGFVEVVAVIAVDEFNEALGKCGSRQQQKDNEKTRNHNPPFVSARGSSVQSQDEASARVRASASLVCSMDVIE